MEKTYEYEMKDEEVALFRHPFQYLKKLDKKRYLEIYLRSWIQTLFAYAIAVLIEKSTQTPLMPFLMPYGVLLMLAVSLIFYSRRICKKAIIYSMAVKAIKEKTGLVGEYQNVMMSVRVKGRKIMLCIREFEQ